MPVLIHQSIRMMLALAAAFYFQHVYFSDGYWIILSAFFGIALQNKFYYSYPNLGLLLTAAVASVLVLVANLFSYNTLLYAVFLVVVSYYCVSLGYEDRKYWGHAGVILLYAVLSGVLLTNFSGAVTRFASIWTGFFIALVIRLTVFSRTHDSEREAIKSILLVCNQYLQCIFSAMLKRDYENNTFAYERSFHACRRRLLAKLLYLHDLLQEDNKPVYLTIEAQLEKLYENILSLGNTLLRINDVSIFEMTTKEIQGIAKSTDEILKSLAKAKKPEDMDDLSYHIQQLEDVNMSGVQLVAKDPLPFFLFIEDCKLLERRFEILAEDLHFLDLSHGHSKNIATTSH